MNTIRQYILNEISASSASQAFRKAHNDILNYESEKGAKFRSMYYRLMDKFPNMSDSRKKKLTDYGKENFYIGDLQKKDKQARKFKDYTNIKRYGRLP
jgi:hypothetical protein